MRSEQLGVSQGTQDRRCPGQNLARSGGWKRVDRGCGPERLRGVRGSRETHGAPRKANRRQRRVEAHSTDAEGGLRGKGSAVRDSTGNPARGGHDSPYAKGNFSFERVICDWRTRVAVLDLRLKK